jgi:hypothetical protein
VATDSLGDFALFLQVTLPAAVPGLPEPSWTQMRFRRPHVPTRLTVFQSEQLCPTTPISTDPPPANMSTNPKAPPARRLQLFQPVRVFVSDIFARIPRRTRGERKGKVGVYTVRTPRPAFLSGALWCSAEHTSEITCCSPVTMQMNPYCHPEARSCHPQAPLGFRPLLLRYPMRSSVTYS